MSSETIDTELLKKYLLDDLSEEEMVKMEERFFEDDSLFEEISALEDELHYDYQQGRLGPRERKIFAEKFLQTSGEREHGEYAGVFLQASKDLLEKERSEENPFDFWQKLTAFFNSPLKFGMAAASLLVVCLIGVFLFLNLDTGERLAELPDNSNRDANRRIFSEDEKNKPEVDVPQPETASAENRSGPAAPMNAPSAAPQKELVKKRPPSRPRRSDRKGPKTAPNAPKTVPRRTFIALVLAPGNLSRSGGEKMPAVRLNPKTSRVRISLLIAEPGESDTFRASVQNLNDDAQIWSSGPVKLQKNKGRAGLQLNIPAKILKRADYQISLSAQSADDSFEEIETYYFRVLK